MPTIATSRKGRIFDPGDGLPIVPWTGVTVTELQKTQILEKFEAGNYKFSLIDISSPSAPVPSSDAPMSESRVAAAILASEGRVGMIGQAANRSGVNTAVAVSPANHTAIPGVVLAVPPSKRNVHLVSGVVWGITTAGAGRLEVAVYEIVSGVATILNSAYRLTTAASPAAGAFGGIQVDEHPIGPSDNWRVYGLYARVARDAGSNLAAYTHNFNTAAAQSYLRAVAL